MSTSSPPASSMNTSGLSSNTNRRSKIPLAQCSESALKSRIVAGLKRRWPKAWVYCPTDRIRSGVPDIVCVLPPSGFTLAIEVKTPTGRVDPIQTATLQKIRNAGGFAWVIRSMEEFRHVVLHE